MTKMKKAMHVLILFVSVLLIFMACSSSSPQDQMKEIEKLLNEDFPVTEEQKEEVDAFTARGKSLLEEGKAAEASEAFAGAIKILEMAQDAHIFNKAD
jgi:outer membrane biogenesis lipoprotein LolB